MSDNNAALRDALWKSYQEHYTHVRHYETQRSTLASAVIAITAALLGLVTFDKALTLTDLPLTAFLAVLAVFGAIFSVKQYERASLHAERAKNYRDAVDRLLPGAPLKQIEEQADEVHDKAFPRLHRLRINKFWLALYLLIACLGVILSIIAALYP